MKIRAAVGTLTLVLLTAIASSPQTAERLGPAPVPDILFAFPEAAEPAWVAASKAVDAAGRARVNLMGRAALGLQKRLDEPDTGQCLHFGKVYVTHADPPERASLDDALLHSRIQVRAEVTNKAFGFHGDIPGQLLQVVPIETFGEPLPARHYYLFIPVGEFLLGDRLLCKEDADYAEPPEVGAEVFLFISGRLWGPNGELLLLYGPGDILPVARDGSLVLPEQYARAAEAQAPSESPRSKSELLDRLERRSGEVTQP